MELNSIPDTVTVTLPGLIVLSVYGISGGDDTAASIKRGVNACLSDRDCLLLHDLMNRHSIVLGDVNTTQHKYTS